MKYSTKDLLERVIGTCTGIVEEFILDDADNIISGI